MGQAKTRFAALLLLLAWGLPLEGLAQTTVKYVHTDALGSVVAMTNSSGAVVETTREYEPYGQQLTPAIQDGPGYTGHVQDAATGLTYMQQRYYDPQLGVFLSVDPVTAYDNGDMRFFNRYAYAFNNPYRFTDPDGRNPSGRNMPKTAEEAEQTLAIVGTVVVVVGAEAATTKGLGLIPKAFAAFRAWRAASASSRARTLANNVAQGRAGEAATRAKLGDKIAGEQVTFKTSDGTRTRADFVTKQGDVVETKTGNAVLSSGQTKLKADIDAGRQVTPVGRNAENAGLSSGQPTTMKSCTVDRHC